MCKKNITKFVKNAQNQRDFHKSPKVTKLVNTNYQSVNGTKMQVRQDALIAQNNAFCKNIGHFTVKIIYNYTNPSVSYSKILTAECEDESSVPCGFE